MLDLCNSEADLVEAEVKYYTHQDSLLLWASFTRFCNSCRWVSWYLSISLAFAVRILESPGHLKYSTILFQPSIVHCICPFSFLLLHVSYLFRSDWYPLTHPEPDYSSGKPSIETNCCSHLRCSLNFFSIFLPDFLSVICQCCVPIDISDFVIHNLEVSLENKLSADRF